MLAQALETENFEDVVDPRLGNNFVASEMFRMIEAAAACVRHSGSKRPRMSQVIRVLLQAMQFIIHFVAILIIIFSGCPSVFPFQVVRALDSMDELSDLSNGVKPGQSGIFESREQSAQIRMFQKMAFGSQE